MADNCTWLPRLEAEAIIFLMILTTMAWLPCYPVGDGGTAAVLPLSLLEFLDYKKIRYDGKGENKEGEEHRRR